MVTILELALHRGAKAEPDGRIKGDEFERVGLAILGGCECCGASIGACGAYPSRSGYWRCRYCIGSFGFPTVEQANADIFGSSATAT